LGRDSGEKMREEGVEKDSEVKPGVVDESLNFSYNNVCPGVSLHVWVFVLQGTYLNVVGSGTCVSMNAEIIFRMTWVC
jgi:hypothetical protein